MTELEQLQREIDALRTVNRELTNTVIALAGRHLALVQTAESVTISGTHVRIDLTDDARLNPWADFGNDVNRVHDRLPVMHLIPGGAA